MRRALGVAAIFIAAAVGLSSPAGALTSQSSSHLRAKWTWFEEGIAMSPRIQWNANGGYCGEVSFISAGMYFGQYTGQWTVREVTAPGVPQTKIRSQLLLGVNDLKAARAMRLRAVAFDSDHQRSTPEFLRWVKTQFMDDHVVIMGVFNNVNTLDEGGVGDSEYDHIVPVFGFGSGTPLTSTRYIPTDTITISDNGLHSVGPNYPFLYTYNLAEFQETRTEANMLGSNLYSLKYRPANYATAVLGVADPQRVTIPVRLTSSGNSEGVWNTDGLTPPKPSQITLTVKVRIPDRSSAYRVYMYDRFADVPTRDFNAARARASRVWTIPAGAGSVWMTSVTAMSNDTRVFRAVPIGAP